MSTVALCRRFFEKHGYPLLRDTFPQIIDRFSAARIGGGSDVLGYDDEYSRKGEWGPTFQLFLSDQDYTEFGPAIHDELRKKLPAEFEGFPTEHPEGPGTDVFSYGGYLRERIGVSRFPVKPLEWLDTNEAAICQFIRGEVFYDPTQTLTKLRRQFSTYYPSDVWKLYAARAAYACWFFGEYNYTDRIAPRGDIVTGLVARGSFCDAAMRLTFLLNRRYAPYWKWLHREFESLPEIAPDLDPVLHEIVSATSMGEQGQAITDASTLLRDAIREAGLLRHEDAQIDRFGAFDIMKTLENPEIAKQPVRGYVST